MSAADRKSVFARSILLAYVAFSLVVWLSPVKGGGTIQGEAGTSSVVLNGATSGSTTISVAAVAGSPATWTLPTATSAAGGALTDVAGDGTLSWVVPGAGSVPRNLFYGDGSSGSGTMDGSTTVFGLAPTGGNTYTATANIYATSLTINSGITLKLGGYLIYCSTSFTDNGTLSSNGNAAAGSTGGTGVTVGYWPATSAGQPGTTTALTATVGTAGVLSGGCGGGGLSAGTTAANGAGPTVSTFLDTQIRTCGVPNTASSGTNWNQTTGTLGGRGSGDGANAGGGGGSFGGIVYVKAKTIAVGAAGQFSCVGGNGGNGAGGTAGGGGGGGGGAILLFADSYAGTAIVAGTNALVTGGNGGTGQGGAGNGGTGTTGSVYRITVLN